VSHRVELQDSPAGLRPRVILGVRPTRMNSHWESWDWDTVHGEVESLRLSEVEGLAEADVRDRFGEPDQVVSPGTEKADASGNVLFRADADLCYYRLLPHTCLSISMSGGRAATMSLWPKWKRCPAESRDTLGALYAPE